MANRLHRYLHAGCIAALLCAYGCASAATYNFDGASRIVAISDPHGAYDAMVRTLQHADIVDAAGHWSAADTHLVITGDLLDRGADSRKVMDFVMQLETEAADTGGRVHLLLGNHEVMNLVGDLRYVAAGEYAAFADEEAPGDRERWFRKYADDRLAAGEVDEAAIRAEFDKTRPPGFYAHRKAFAADGVYGEWLLEKPLIVVVNGNAFVHGGLPPLVAELGLDELNDRLRGDVSAYVAALDVLAEAELLDPAMNFYEHAKFARSLSVMTPMADEVGTALETIVERSGSSIHGPRGPLWYRGAVGCSVLVEGDRLDAVLAAIGASRVVIGHTPTVTRGVLQRLDGRVIEIDTGMLKTAYRGSGHALIIDGDEFWVASEENADLQRVAPHPRRVGYRPGNLTADKLESLLASGEIVATGKDELNRTVVEFDAGGDKITAIFSKDTSRKGVNPELAAYRLDRALQLDMVPVTVAREIGRDKGALQYLPDNISNEQLRSASGRGSGAWCPLPDQWNAMYIFDALVYNPGRPPTNMLYNLENWSIMLTGFDGAFAARGGRPRYLQDAPLVLTGEWRSRLAALTEENLAEALGASLDERRIRALLKRRDDLLGD